jgi:integrase
MRTPLHPLEKALQARVRLLATTLRPATVSHYCYTVRLLLAYLRKNFPEVRQPGDLKRDPHILGWLEHLWMWRVSYSGKPWCTSSRAGHLIRIRKLLDLLSDHKSPPRPGLLLSEDIPRPDQTLPRPLTPEDDARLQAEFRRRNDLETNALLLTRLTGMRIGETSTLAVDCLRHLGAGQWVLHVPVGKLHSERWVPVDEEARAVVNRLLFLRALPGLTLRPQLLLPHPKRREDLPVMLRRTLCECATRAGIQVHIVPHQLRHTFATSMLRAGVSMPALMKLLGHRSANMTLRYVEITQKDLQREFHMARQTPRYLIPIPPSATNPDSDAADRSAVLKQLSAAIRLLDLYRQQNPGPDDKPLRLLLRRMVRTRSRFQNLTSLTKN